MGAERFQRLNAVRSDEDGVPKLNQDIFPQFPHHRVVFDQENCFDAPRDGLPDRLGNRRWNREQREEHVEGRPLSFGRLNFDPAVVLVDDPVRRCKAEPRSLA